jgi:ribose/xylose/arabinose/galactoside ABC-type transport system permease subunit
MSENTAPATSSSFRPVVPYLAWEVVLLLIVAALAAIAAATTHFFGGGGPWYQIVAIGFAAAGFGLSLRTGTPNLSVAAVSIAAGVGYAKLTGQEDFSAVAAGSLLVLVAAVAGLVLGAVTGLTGLPGWAVSLAGLALATALALAGTTDVGVIAVPPGAAMSSSGAALWAVLFLVVSIGGGVLWLVPAIRRGLTTVERDSDGVRTKPLSRRLTAALVGFAGSTALAALGGVLTAAYLRAGTPNGIDLAIPVAAVLLGGASAVGGRSGLAGTALGVLAMATVNQMLAYHGAKFWERELVAGLVIVVGLLIGWVLDLFATRLEKPSYP